MMTPADKVADRRPNVGPSLTSTERATDAPRNTSESSLADTLSPGRMLRFSAPAFVPVPTAAQHVPNDAATSVFTLARWDADTIGECVILGSNAELTSAFAFKVAAGQPVGSRVHTAFGAARLVDMFDTLTIAESQLYPWASGGGGASLIIVSGPQSDYSLEAGKWGTLPGTDSLQRSQNASGPIVAPFQSSSPSHRADFSFPPGDLSAATGLAANTVQLASREQPFGVRLPKRYSLFALLAIDARYVERAQQAVAGAGAGAVGYFPVRARGSVFVSPLRDDRRFK